MWAPAWGYLFWLFLHALGRSYENHDLSDTEIVMLKQFVICLLCLLPCPACREHAKGYVITHPIEWKKGNDISTYFFNFHNEVNRTAQSKKRELNWEEAQIAISTNLGNEIFRDDFWNVLVWICWFYTRTPDVPSEPDKAMLLGLIHAAPFAVPFWEFKTHDDRIARDVLLEVVQFANVNTRDLSVQTIAHMFNSLAGEFGLKYRDMKEMNRLFEYSLDHKQMPAFVRSLQVREEDHKKIKSLESQIANFNITDDDYWYQVSIGLAVALSIVMFILIITNWSRWKLWNISRLSQLSHFVNSK